MKALNDLLYRAPLLQREGPADIAVSGVQYDSRQVRPGQVFVALRGVQVDGHAYIPQALEQGATAIVAEHWPEERNPDVAWVKVKNSSQALSALAANWWDNPAEKLEVVGVTGTNGKTTFATLLYQLLELLGCPSGLLSTAGVRVHTQLLPTTHTTPDPLNLQENLHRMVEAGCSYAVMEVSSHALDQNRSWGLPFRGAVFTNLTHDHLDYHGTFANYRDAKKKLFDDLRRDAFALTNLDDRNGHIMVQNTAATVRTFSLQQPADYHAKVLDDQLSGLHLLVENRELLVQLVGRFNAYNILAVLAAARELGFPLEEVLLAASRLQPVRGRMERLLLPNGVIGLVDYAHTPDALAKVLDTLHDVLPDPYRVYTVVGCGGNRDTAKRPEMARIAANQSYQALLTSDNPRHEDPQAILQDMQQGVPPALVDRVLTLADRREAIRVAVRMARPGDVVLVAGKGHETYQEIRGERLPFNDVEELLAAAGPAAASSESGESPLGPPPPSSPTQPPA